VPLSARIDPDDTNAALSGFGRLSVLRHAWKHIKESWRAALAGALVTAILPVLIQWGDSYSFSESGWDQVTGGGWIWSVAAVGLWLAAVALWHLMCAPMSHAREILRAHGVHYAAEIERVREAGRAEATPAINNQINIFPGDVVQTETLLRQLGFVEPRPSGPNQLGDPPASARPTAAQGSTDEEDDPSGASEGDVVAT
jgi:hypothetical protein